MGLTRTREEPGDGGVAMAGARLGRDKQKQAEGKKRPASRGRAEGERRQYAAAVARVGGMNGRERARRGS